MSELLPMIEMSELCTNRPAVLEKVKKGPITLTIDGEIVAVLSSARLWDKLADYIEEEEDIIDMLKAELEIAEGKDSMVTLTQAEIEAWLAEEDEMMDDEMGEQAMVAGECLREAERVPA